MPRRHRIIKKIEGRKRYEKRAQLLITASALIVLLSLPLASYKARLSSSFDSIETMEMIQIARNYTRGNGFTTNYIRPEVYTVLPKLIRPSDLMYPPLYIWMLGQLPSVAKGTVLNPPDANVAKVADIFFFATAILLYFMGRAVCDIRTGFITAFLFIFNVTILRETASGTPETFTAFLLTVFFAVVYLSQNQAFVTSFIAGAVLGFCYLTQYALLVMVIPLAVGLWMGIGPARWRRIIAMLIGLLIVIAPWMIRNMACGGSALCGQPLSSLFLSSSLMGGGWHKFYLQFSGLYAKLSSSYGILIFAFFLVSALLRFENSELQKAKGIFLVCFLLVFFTSAMGNGQPAILSAFIPVVTLLGVKTFLDLNERYGAHSEQRKLQLLMLFIALCVVPYVVVLMGKNVRGISKWALRERLEVLADMQGMTYPGDIVMTNAPEWLAYYGEFNTLPIPKNRKEFVKWQRNFGKLRFVALTPYGISGQIAQRALSQKKVPEWFISYEALSYPEGEMFFRAEEVGASRGE